MPNPDDVLLVLVPSYKPLDQCGSFQKEPGIAVSSRRYYDTLQVLPLTRPSKCWANPGHAQAPVVHNARSLGLGPSSPSLTRNVGGPMEVNSAERPPMSAAGCLQTWSSPERPHQSLHISSRAFCHGKEVKGRICMLCDAVSLL